MLNNNYLVYLIVAVLFFVFGWSSNYFFTISPQESMEGEENQQTVQESERSKAFLFGVVQETQIDEENSFSAKLDLSASFNQESFDKPNPVRNFEYKEGTTNVYRLEGEDIATDTKKEATLEDIEEGDELAIRCTIPPKFVDDIKNHNAFTADEILIIKKENE